jgi:hypothetical protein
MIQDERNQLLTSLAWIHFRWNDWRLAWDPQLNGRLAKLNVPVEVYWAGRVFLLLPPFKLIMFQSIWIPDIILYNNAAQEYLKEMVCFLLNHFGGA